jgi:hypothetical protein
LSCAGCSDEFPIEDFEVGQNGEPPKALHGVYHKQFVVDEKNYVNAFGLIHVFLIENQFYAKYTQCFDDVLDIRKRSRAGFSCIALQAEQGPPTKVYLRVIVDEVFFNQLDRDNRLKYTVEMYAIERYTSNGVGEQLVQAFEAGTGEKLANLYAGVHFDRKEPNHNKSIQPTADASDD